MTLLDSVQVVDSGLQTPGSRLAGFLVSGTGILDSNR